LRAGSPETMRTRYGGDMENKGVNRFNRENVKVVLYVIGILAALGFLSTVFYKPVFFVQGITFCFSLLALALPIVITYLLYDREAMGTSAQAILWVSVPVILFCGLMLSVSGPVGLPGLLNIMQPMMCPAGYAEVAGDLSTRQFAMPGRVMTVSLQSICHGELGTYAPEKYAQIVSGMVIYLLYCGMYFSIVLVVWKQKFFMLRRYAAQGIILALFIPLLFVTLLNASFRDVAAKPMNGLIYRGQAVSLVEAVKQHKIGVIRDLLARGGDINAKNHLKESALGVAQKFKDKEVLGLFSGQIIGGSDSKKALLDKGIVYDVPNFFKRVEANDIESVKLFLSAGMDVNEVGTTGEAYGNTALAIAAGKGHKDLVQLLLDRKADVNALHKKGSFGRTPLYAAAMACRDDIVKLLIQRGADVNVRDRYGYTVLMMASGATYGQTDASTACPAAVRTLLENKADINARRTDGYTALLYAVERTGYSFKYDPVKKWDVEVLNKERYDVVKYLLEHGADPNVNSYDSGKTPLRIARSGKVKEVIQLLEQYHGRE